MEHTLSQFAQMLRSAGIPVSTAEVIEGAAALCWIAPEDRVSFRVALQTNFVKSQAHLPHFERCFELFFEQQQKEVPTPFSNSSSLDVNASEDQALWQEFFAERGQNPFMQESQSGQSATAPLSLNDQLWQFLAQGTPQFLESLEQARRGEGLIPQGGAGMPFSGMLALGRKLELMLALDQAREALNAFFSRAIQATQEIDRLRALYRQRRLQNTRLRLLNEMLTHPENTAAQARARIVQPPGFSTTETRQKSLASLTSAEKEQLVHSMKNLIRKVNTAYTLRMRRQHRGKIDLKQTLRESLSVGGVPIRLYYRQKQRRKGDLIVLCDVSSSVYTMAHIMLSLIYAIAVQFEKIRSFAFIDGIAEITEFFQDTPWEEALQKSLDRQLIRGGRQQSDYGKSLREFSQQHFRLIGPRTTVIIFGDARNNGHLTEHRLLEKIYKKAKRVLWLNPESSRSWNSGDSEVKAYLPYCTEFRECRTFNQLEDFILALAGP